MNVVMMMVALTVGQCEGGRHDAGVFSAGISVGVDVSRAVVRVPAVVVGGTVEFFRTRKPVRTLIEKAVEARPVRSFFKSRKPARRVLGFVFRVRCRG